MAKTNQSSVPAFGMKDKLDICLGTSEMILPSFCPRRL